MALAVEGAVRGQTWLWVAPTFDQVRIGWDETRKAVGQYASFTQQRMMAEFPTGGRIIYRSLDDPDHARGHTADGLVIDEAAGVQDDAWYEVLRPMLIDTAGIAWIGSTPRGRNWFWREWMKAEEREDSMAWQTPTLGVRITDQGLVREPHPLENPDVPFEEIEALWRTMPERVFRQEILAEFLESGGGVFRGVTAAATLEPQGPEPGHQYVFGIDWAREADWTVIIVIDIATHSVVAMDRFNQIDYALQRQRLIALAERYQPTVIIAEANAMGQPIIEELQRDGLPVRAFITTNATKAEIIERLALAFERGDIRLLKDDVLVAELQAYTMERLRSGMVRYTAPGGMHDDCVMALALAWQGVVAGRPVEYAPNIWM